MYVCKQILPKGYFRKKLNFSLSFIFYFGREDATVLSNRKGQGPGILLGPPLSLFCISDTGIMLDMVQLLGLDTEEVPLDGVFLADIELLVLDADEVPLC